MTLRPHRRLRTRNAAALATSLLLPLGGCCDLALLLCGPDTSRWVRIDYETPDAGLATFMEAVRRDNTQIIYESLSTAFKEQQDLPGELEATIGWERMKQQFSGVHLLGTAAVSGPIPVGTARRYQLVVSGHGFHVELVRIAMVEVRYQLDGHYDVYGYPLDPPDSLNHLVALERADFEATAVLTIEGLDLPDKLRAADILEVRATYQWKVSAIRPIPES